MIITLLTAVFVLISLLLVVTVPVALATPGEWEVSKTNFNRFFQIWVLLVVLIAAADGLSASI
jgi:photosystem II core protein PsbZ